MKSKQNGASVFGIIIFIFLICQFLYLVLRIAPIYYTDHKVGSVFNKIPQELDRLDKAQGKSLGLKDDVRRFLNANFKINGVRSVSGINDVTFTKERDGIAIDLDYVLKDKLFGTIFVYGEFKHHLLIKRKSG